MEIAQDVVILGRGGGGERKGDVIAGCGSFEARRTSVLMSEMLPELTSDFTDILRRKTAPLVCLVSVGWFCFFFLATS